MSRLTLDGRGVLLSGATGGIGKEIARELSERGAKVVLLGRPSDRLDDLADELAPYGAVAAEADITDHDDVVAAVNDAARRVDGLTAVVAGAGVVHPSLIAEQSEEDVRAIVDVNLYGTLWTLQAALPHVDRAEGHLLAIGSVAGLLPAPLAGLYPATKAAIGELVAQLRLELTHRATSAGIVYFGKVDTGMSDTTAADGPLGRVLERTPNAFSGSLTPAEAAHRVVEALVHRRGAVVHPLWQLPLAVPQLTVQRLIELGIRFTPLSPELPSSPALLPDRDAPTGSRPAGSR